MQIFNLEKFAEVHLTFMNELISALVEETNLRNSYYTCLIFIDAFYSQIIQYWELVYELAHNGQLQGVDATGFN